MTKQLPIGIYEKALPFNVDWFERLSKAKEAGFDFVEISIDESDERLSRLDWSAKERANLRAAIAETGVPLTTMCLSGHRKYPLGSADTAIRQRAYDIMQRAVDFAVDVGVRVIQLAGYYVYYEPHTADSLPRYQEGLAQGLEWASQAGVMLAMENVDGNDVDSVTQAMYFVDAFNSPWFQVYPDIGNLSEHSLDVCAELELARGHMVGVHVKDTVPGEPRRVPFGQGTVPFVEAFKKLAEMNFTGPVLLEMWNDDSPDSMRIIQESREWVMTKMREGGLISEEK
ncbi:MAG TPA: L-ribulose-5-phosphate 3-epimerase [Chloroflexi bacterium]|nr:MAG: xylulose 5-phosphate 3-epimerase [Anaerolineaceae bacterium 4572_5.2]HEY83739.1 L-ribulose-5-phosphate 3-epimerase [Chloroflexota bacterium]